MHDNADYDKLAHDVALEANAKFAAPIVRALQEARKHGQSDAIEAAEQYWAEHPRASISAWIRSLQQGEGVRYER